MVAAFPDLALGGAFLATWIAPAATFGASAIGYFMLLMLLEFIIIHSSAFMGNVAIQRGPRGRRAKRIVGLGAFYTMFVAGFALMFRVWWPLVAFWVLTVNRMSGVLFDSAPEGEEKRALQAGWAAATLFYLMAVFLTTPLPWFPTLGVTPEIVRAASLPGSGLWVSEPHRVLAAGAIYFTAVGVSELFGHAWALKGVQSSTA